MSAAAIFIDSIYFRKLVISRQSHGTPMTLMEIFTISPLDWPSLSVQGSLTLTMWNNLQYNLDKDNLALHGLHPRFFHLLLNFPVLFGNLALLGLTTIIRKVIAREWSSRSKLVTGTFNSPEQTPLPQHVLRNTDDSYWHSYTFASFLFWCPSLLALSYSGICGMVALSSMPHQEARFLTPLILPLVISLSGRISRLGRKFWVGYLGDSWMQGLEDNEKLINKFLRYLLAALVSAKRCASHRFRRYSSGRLGSRYGLDSKTVAWISRLSRCRLWRPYSMYNRSVQTR